MDRQAVAAMHRCLAIGKSPSLIICVDLMTSWFLCIACVVPCVIGSIWEGYYLLSRSLSFTITLFNTTHHHKLQTEALSSTAKALHIYNTLTFLVHPCTLSSLIHKTSPPTFQATHTNNSTVGVHTPGEP